MAWTTLTFATLEVLSSTKMTQLQANFAAIVTSASGSPTCSGASIIPSSAVGALFIDQNYDNFALQIDTEATLYGCIDCYGKYGISITQDLSDGWGLYVQRNLNETGSAALVNFKEDHATSVQDVLSIQNDGQGAGLNMTSNYVGAANVVARFFHDGDNVNAYGIDIQCGKDSDAGVVNTYITIKDGDGGSVAGCTSTGGTATWHTTSDKRLKKNITDTKYGLKDLLKIEVKDFKFIKQNNEVPVCGMIAQDLYPIFPFAVSKPNNEEKEYYGIDYGRVTPLLIKAIQDQQVVIDGLNKRIGVLEKK